MSRREEILTALKTVDLLSSPAIGSLQMLNDPNVQGDKVARIIELDPALTTNVLRFANSAYFGCTQKISTIKDALVRLGMKSISRMVYMSAASQLAPHQVRGYDLQPGELWDHLLATAVCTDVLAERLGIQPPAATFTAALLHDIGKLVLGNNLRVDVQPVLALVREENITFEEAEQRVLGIDQAEVGAALLKQWHLPEDITHSIQHHFQPEGCEEEDKLIVDLMHVGNIIAILHAVGPDMPGFNYEIAAETQERLGITRELIDEIVSDLGDEIQKVSTAAAA